MLYDSDCYLGLTLGRHLQASGIFVLVCWNYEGRSILTNLNSLPDALPISFLSPAKRCAL